MSPDDHQDDQRSVDGELAERRPAARDELRAAFLQMVAGRGDDERWFPEAT